MADPTPYKRSYSFTNYQEDTPAAPLPGNRIDVELDNIEQSSKALTEVVNAGFRIEADLGAVVQVAAELPKVVFVADNMPDVRQAAEVAPYVVTASKLFLGAFPSDPSSDTAGDPLTVGATYYNTVISQSFIYGGALSGWVPIAQVSVGGVLQGSVVTAAGQTAFTLGDYVSVSIALNGEVLRPGVDFTLAQPDVIIPAAIEGDVVTYYGILKGSVSDAAAIVRQTFITTAGGRTYALNSDGEPLNLTATNHVLMGPSPMGVLTEGVDYEVVDGAVQLAYDPRANELYHVISMPRFTNTEAQVILQEHQEILAEYAGQAEQSAIRAENAATRFTLPPEFFGAVGNDVDDEADDTAAVQAWVSYLRANGLTGDLSKFYAVTGLDMYPSSSYGIRGAGDRQCGFIIRNANRNGVGLKFTHPTTPSTRGKQYQISDFGVIAAEGTKACLIEHRYASAPKWIRIRVSGYHGATGVRLEKVWNGDIKELSVWGCGHNVVTKDVPDGTTFSIATGTAPIIASADVFGPEDVGKYFTLAASASTTPQTFLITGFIDARTVSVDQPRARVYTNVPGTFGGIRGSMDAGSNVLTLEADRLTSDAIGRKVYVVGGALNGTTPRPLPARIIGVDGADITLDAVAQRNVALAELAFDPAADFGDNDYTVVQKTNDFNCTDLHVEHHMGCGLVLTGVTLYFPNVKLHAFGHDKTNEEATNIQLIAYDAAGYMTASLQQVVASNKSRVLVCGMDQILSIPFLEALMTHDREVVHMQECGNGGVVDIGVLKGIGGDQNQHAIDGCLTTDGTGLLLARIVGAPEQAYRRLNVSLPA